MRLRHLLLTGLAMATAVTVVQPAAANEDSEIRILRDGYGVPHIFADNTYGLYFGFGYALAGDQLFEVELLKRTARGRVAEVLGSAYVATDKAARARIDVASLKKQYGALPAEDRAIFDGMADGLNSRISLVLRQRATILPKGFIEGGFLPERWTPIDILAVYEHSMVARFSDINGELDNLTLLARLNREHGPEAGWKIFEQLRWVDDDRAPTTIAGDDKQARSVPTFAAPGPHGVLPNHLLTPPEATAQTVFPGNEVPHASNAWVVSSSRLASGETVLVNGPQMGYAAASYIWAVGLHGAGFNLVGSGPVGSPWLIFGTNGDIGWGATAGLGDTVDIYQEKLDPRDPQRYFFDGQWRGMTRRDEVIHVKGQADVTLPIWSTAHGLVDLLDAAHSVAYTRRRSWEGREVISLVSWVHAMQAHDYPTWRSRVAKVAIAVNNYYVDRQGNTAYQFLGLFPLRPKAQDFRLPATGDGSMEWRGFQDTLDNPYVLNPKSGLLANWNNKPQPGYGNSDFMYWSPVDRVREIDEAAAASRMSDANAAWALIEKTSFTDVTARYFIDLLRSHRADAEQRAPEATALLLGWDGVLADRKTANATPQYILYQAFMARLLEQLYAPILPRDKQTWTDSEKGLIEVDPAFPSMGAKIAYAALVSPQDSPVLAHRRPANLLSDALASAWQTIITKLGPRPAAWLVPAVAHDFAVVNYAGVPVARATDATSLPVLMNRGTENDRIVFKDGNVTYCDVTPPGQSGFVAPNGTRSPHARDQLDLYENFGCKPQWLTPREVEQHAVSSELISYDQAPRSTVSPK